MTGANPATDFSYDGIPRGGGGRRMQNCQLRGIAKGYVGALDISGNVAYNGHDKVLYEKY